MAIRKYNIIFVGTPDFSVPALKALIADQRFHVAAVITSPDAKVGRKQILTPPPVKVAAEKNNILVMQPTKLTGRDVATQRLYDAITARCPDAIITIAYGQILPKKILEVPKHGCLNLHASLLPKYRGASPIQTAIANGETETGVTLMKMDTGLDTGPIIAQEKIKINQYDFKSSCHSRESGSLEINKMDSCFRRNDNIDTGESLHDKLSLLSAEVIIKYLEDYLEKKLTPKIQTNKDAALAPKLTRESGRIDWSKPAAAIERLVRAYHPWPGTWTERNGQKLKIISVFLSREGATIQPRLNQEKINVPGDIFLYKNKLAVQCGDGMLFIEKLQLSGKKIMSAKEFLRGYRDNFLL